MKTKPCVDSREPRDGAFVPKRNYSDKEPAFWNRNWYQKLYCQMQMVLIALYRIKEGLMNFTQIRAHLIHQRQSSSSSMDPHCLLVSDIRKTLLKNRDIVFLFKMWISKIHKKNFILKITIWKQIPWQASTLSARSLAHSLVAPILTEFLVICKIEWLLGYVYQIFFKAIFMWKDHKIYELTRFSEKIKNLLFLNLANLDLHSSSLITVTSPW